MKRHALLALFLVLGLVVKTQDLTRILFVFDASNSMNGKWQSQAKIDIARDLLSRTMEELKGTEDLEVALRVYGHQSSIATSLQDCDDTELVVPFGQRRNNDIIGALKDIVPKGTTPIARSLERAADDFPDDRARNIILLITDGVEACDEDPCAVSLALQRKGVILKPFVIGIGTDKSMEYQFECIGNYYDAGSEETFENVLKMVVSQALNNTTVQVDLLDESGVATETNVPMTFYDTQSGLLLYNFVHTMNQKGLPDTIPLDPIYRYDIVVHTIPEIEINDRTIDAGGHTHIDIPAAQGQLELRMNGRDAYKDLKCIIRRSGESTTIHVQDFNTIERYLSGDYDLEILTTPRMVMENVKVPHKETALIAIPTPGVLNASFPSGGYGAVMSKQGDQLEWVCPIDENSSQQQIVLQPGHYRLVFRSRGSKESIYTLSRDFEIKSEGATTVKF